MSTTTTFVSMPFRVYVNINIPKLIEENNGKPISQEDLATTLKPLINVNNLSDSKGNPFCTAIHLTDDIFAIDPKEALSISTNEENEPTKTPSAILETLANLFYAMSSLKAENAYFFIPSGKYKIIKSEDDTHEQFSYYDMTGTRAWLYAIYEHFVAKQAILEIEKKPNLDFDSVMNEPNPIGTFANSVNMPIWSTVFPNIYIGNKNIMSPFTTKQANAYTLGLATTPSPYSSQIFNTPSFFPTPLMGRKFMAVDMDSPTHAKSLKALLTNHFSLREIDVAASSEKRNQTTGFMATKSTKYTLLKELIGGVIFLSFFNFGDQSKSKKKKKISWAEVEDLKRFLNAFNIALYIVNVPKDFFNQDEKIQNFVHNYEVHIEKQLNDKVAGEYNGDREAAEKDPQYLEGKKYLDFLNTNCIVPPDLMPISDVKQVQMAK